MNLIRSLTLCLSLSLPHVSQAQAPQLSEIIEAQMRPGWRTDQGTHIAALHLRLADDWITYWRHPGESGLVSQFDWSGSRNLAQARIHWPEPRLYIKAGARSIGYSDELVLPIELTPIRSEEPIELDGAMMLGVCNDICIPVDLALRVSVSGAGRHDHVIATALDSRPGNARAAGLRSVACEVSPDRRGLVLSASLDMPRMGAEEFVLVEMAGTQMPARVLGTQRDGDAILGHTLFQTRGAGIDRSAVRVSVISENGTVVHQGCSLN